ncbi:DUF7948 domain-containing protein [Fibrella aestuarina]|nr:hypothetical protein [Fibrella aestuarina]
MLVATRVTGQAPHVQTLMRANPTQATLAQQTVKNHATSLAFETNVFGGEASYLLTTPQVNLAFMPDRVQFAATPATEQVGKPVAPVNWSLRWLGANAPRQPEAINELGDKGEYRFIDKHGSHRIGRYAELWYNDIYDRTDLRFYGRGSADLEYDFVVKPGGNPQAIRLAMDGVNDIQLSPTGELVLNLPFGALRKARPYAYQLIGGQEKAVPVRYTLQPDHSIGFAMGAYDPGQPLVIDPVVILWSTFIGGTTRDANGGIWVDNQGFIYLTGTTRAGTFPTTTASSVAPAVTYERVFVMKLNANGNQILWSTILDTHTGDGNGNELNVGLAVGSDSKPVILMSTTTGAVGGTPGNIPPSYTTPGAYQPATAGLFDAYLAKLSADGGTVEWSTYFGGSGSDIAVVGGAAQPIGIDGNNNIYFTGVTNSADLPVTAGAYQSYYKGSDDQFMASFSPTGSLRWSTYFGSRGADRTTAVEVDADGTSYTLGSTANLSSYPLTVNSVPTSYTARATTVVKLSSTGAYLASTAVPFDILAVSTAGGGIGAYPMASDGTGVYFPGRELLVNATPIPFTGALPPGATATSRVVPLIAINKSDLSLRYVRAAANATEVDFPSIAANGNGSVMLLVRGRDNIMTGPQYISPDACITSPTPNPTINTNPTYIATFNTTTGDTQYGSFVNFVAMSVYNPSTRILLKGCNLYVYSTTTGTNAKYYPWTPSAYDASGNTITGYSGPKADQDLLLAKFGPVKLKQNTLTFAGSSTTYCANSVVPAIVGNDASLNLNIPATNQASQCPPQVFYQWQRGNSAGGPWTNVTNATGKDYAPICTGGTSFYRRIAYCASYWLGSACKDSLLSVAVQVNCGGNATHRTNIDPKPYAHCAGLPISRTFAVVPGADGAKPAYTYRWENASSTTVSSGTIAANGTSPIPTGFTQDGTYYLYATDARGCTSKDTLQLTTLSLPAASSTTLVTCGAPTVKLGPLDAPDLADDQTLTFTWTPATGLSGTTILNPTLNTSVIPSGGSATYRLTPTLDGVACASTSVVVVNTSPTPLPALPSLTACQGDNLTLGQGITPDPSFTYQWSPGTGIVSGSAVPTTLATGSLAPASVNAYTYYLTASQVSSGCSLTTSQNVTVYKVSNNAVAGSYPVILCPTDANSTASWTFGTPAEAGIGYTWTAVVSATATDAGTPTSAQAVALLSNSTASTTTFQIPSGVVFPNGGKSKLPYTITYTRTSYNLANPSCSRTDVIEIRYSPACDGSGDVPYCQLTLPAGAEGVCAGANTVIGPTQAATGVNYYWSPIAGLSDAQTSVPLSGTGPFSPYVKANPTTTTSYTLTAVYPGGQVCRLVIKVFGAATSLPTQNFPNNVATCAGQPVTIGGAAIQGYSYLWTPPTGLSSTTLSQPTYTPGTSPSAQFIVKITDKVSTCFIYDTVNVVVRTVAVPVGVGGTFCRTTGRSVTLGTAGPANLTYSWAVTAGTATIASPGSSTTTANIPAQTTDVVFRLTATDPITGCSSVSSVTYTSVANPTLSLTNQLLSCPGGAINIGSEANDPTLTYAWTSTSSGNGLTASEAVKRNPKVTTTGSGPWIYTVTASYNGSCATTQSVTVTAAPTPTVNTVSGAPCSATGVLLSVTNAGSLSGYTYSWSPYAGVLDPPVALSTTGTSTSSIQVYPSVATSYTLTTTAPGGCVQRFVFNVPAPAYTAQANPISICLPRTTNPTVGLSNTIPTGATVSWTTVSGYTNPTTGRISNTAAANSTFIVTDNPPSGIYKYLITVNYGNGCSSTVEQDITVNSITLAAGSDKVICANTCVTIGPDVNGPYNYSWRAVPSSAATDATIDNPANFQTLVCPTGTTTYEVTASDPASGCTLTDQVLVTVTPSPTLTVNSSITACQNAQGTTTVSLAAAAAQSSGTISYWLDASAQTIPVSNTAAVRAGTYYVKATTSTGCTTILPVSVSFNPLPAIAFGTPACRPNSTFSVRFTVSPATATVTANLGTVQGDSVFNVPAGQTLTLTASSSGCVSSTTITAPNCCSIAAALTSATICTGQSATLTATGGTSYTFTGGMVNTTGRLVVSPTTTTTYSVTIGNASGCVSTTTGTVTVNPLPTPALTSSTICVGQSATLTATGGTSYTFTGGTVTTTGRLTVSPTSTTTYSVTVANASGCISTTTGTVTVNSLPTVSATSATVCQGQSGTLTASGASTYRWSTGATTASISVSVAGPYSVTGTSSAGCSATATGSLSVNPLPVAALSSATICAGQSATLTATGGTSYTFTGGTVNTTGTLVVSPASTTTYSVTVANASGCASTTTATVTVNPLPLASLSSATICVGQSATLTATGGSSYSFTGGVTNTTGTLVINLASTTTYSVTVANASGCISTTTGTVTVNSLPVVSATSATVCQGQSGTLTASGASTYRWSTGATTAFISVSVAGTYSVTGTSSAGCSATAIGALTVNPLPVAALSSATVCAGQSATLTATGGTSYSFTGGVINTTGSLVASPASTTTYSVTVANASGCVSTTTATITVNTLPVVAATSATICQGQSATLTASGASTYRWNTGATTASILVTVAGVYSVTGTSSAGCSATATGALTVNPLPVATINPSSATICQGQTATLTAGGGVAYGWSTGANTATITVSPAVTTTYSVTVTNASGCASTTAATVTVNGQPQINQILQGACIGNTSSLTVDATNGGNGTLEYSLNGGAFTTTNNFTLSAATSTTATVVVRTQGSSCSAVQSVEVNCACQTPASLTLLPATPQICAGSSASLTVGVSGATSASLTSSGSGVFSQSVINGGQTVSYLPSATDVQAGSVTLTITSADPDGVGSCQSASLSRVLVINPLPVVAVTPQSATVCSGASAILAASGASTYRWNTGATTASISVSVAGTYSVTGTSSAGCSATATGTLTVNPLPVAALSSATVCVGQSATLTATGGSSYTFNTGLMNTTGTLVVSPTSTTTYSVTVASASGCVSSTTGGVTVSASPTLSVSGVGASCTGGIANSDARLVLLGSSAASRYNVSVGSSYNAASALFGTDQALPAVGGSLLSGQANPGLAAGVGYTVRVYSAQGCYNDVVVVIPSATCECPPVTCVPILIKVIRR